MQELKNFETGSIPDVGQEYWAHVDKMERNKGRNFWSSLRIVVPCAIAAYFSLMLAMWGNQPPYDGSARDGLLTAATTVGLVGFFITGVVAFALSYAYVGNALQQRRWRKEMPHCPRNYHPEMAKVAHALAQRAEIFNIRVAHLHEEAEALPKVSNELYEELLALNSYHVSMQEEDNAIFTLNL